MSLNSYVISLKNQSERRKHIQRIFDEINLKFEFYDAIDQTHINKVLEKYSIKLTASHLSKGEVACYISHFCLWKLVVDNELDYVAVFEDDIYLAKDASVLLKELNWLPREFDVIKLETMLEQVFIFKTTELGNNRYLTKMQSSHMGGAGYIVSKKGALKLINKTLSDGIIAPVDHLIFDWLIANANEVYQINPAICIQDKVYNENSPLFESSLEETRSDKPKKPKSKGFQKVIRELRRIKNQVTTNKFIKVLIMGVKGYRKQVIEYRP